CRLPHRGAGGDDDQVPGLKAGREPVEVAEAGRDAGDVGACLEQRRDPLEAVLEQLLDVAELLRDPALRQVEERLLGAVDEQRGLTGPIEAESLDLTADSDEPTEGRHLADDPRVMRGVGGRRDERGKLVDTAAAADVLELTPLLQLVDERDRVDGLPFCVERERGAVYLRVALAIEVARVEHFADRTDRAGGEEHRPENRFLGFEVLRRDRCSHRYRGDGHRPTQQSIATCAKFVPKTPLCRKKRTYVPTLSPGADDFSPDGPQVCDETVRSEQQFRDDLHTGVDTAVEEHAAEVGERPPPLTLFGGLW